MEDLLEELFDELFEEFSKYVHDEYGYDVVRSEDGIDIRNIFCDGENRCIQESTDSCAE